MKSQRAQKKKQDVKRKEESFLISKIEKGKAVSQALKPEVQIAQIIAQEVDKIVRWINQEKEKLAKNSEHQAFLSLDFKYSDQVKRVAVDSILRLLGSRLLNEKERFDLRRPASLGIQATSKPNLYIYYEHKREPKEVAIQEKYIIFVFKDIKLPTIFTPERIETMTIGEKEELPSPEIPEERITEEKRTPGIFETINKVLLGEEE